jgi:ABC-type bacteriocin/lantibiotic exporter with double-glycine peptidase domain
MNNRIKRGFWNYLKSALSLTREKDSAFSFKPAQLKRILPYLKAHWIRTSIASALIIVVSLATLPIPWLLKMLIDEVLVQRKTNLLNFIILSMVGLQFIKFISAFIMDYLFIVLNQDILVNIQKDLFSRLLKLPLCFYDKHQTGYLVSRIREVNGLGALFSSSIVRLIISLIEGIVGFIIMAKLSWKLTLIAVACIPFYYSVARFSARGLKQSSRALYEQAAIVSKEIQESFSGINVIKAFARENLQTQKIHEQLKQYRYSSILQAIFFSLSSELMFMINSVAGVIILWISSHDILAARFSLGDYIAFSGYFVKMFAPILQLASLSLVFQPAFVSLTRISELFDQVTEEEGPKRIIRLNTLRGDIRFENVSFSYNQNMSVLEDVSFHIQPSQAVALIGPSGSGKTTIIRLLMGLYSSQQGQILIDGHNISSLVLSTLRERMGVVSQRVFLFNDTIRSNILYGNQDANDEDIVRVAQMAGADSFIKRLPHGYDTIVGEAGGMMSAGEIQRIALARCLIKSPDILILDEATSSVDVNTEKRIIDDVNRLFQEKTRITITHKLETAYTADRIFVLAKGKISESNRTNLCNQTL